MPFQPLLLHNPARGDGRNACYSNSVIQILRRTYSLRNTIVNDSSGDPLKNELKQIFIAQGSLEIKSSFNIRLLLGGDFATGSQQCAKEFFDALLQSCFQMQQNPFKFTLLNQYQAPRPSNCYTCVQDTTSDQAISLHLALEGPESTSLHLQDLLNG